MDEKSEEIKSPNYFDWREFYPQLQVLIDNIDVIAFESNQIPKWIPWPEDKIKSANSVYSTDWTVFPLLYTFPGNDPTKSIWVDSTCSYCPQTFAILRNIPGIRTALFSRLGPNTRLGAHTGWEDLANYVLRCHLSLVVPEDHVCGLVVGGEIHNHVSRDIVVFDDSKSHYAYNESPDCERIVLIVDMERPIEKIGVGKCTGGHTAELDEFISTFR